MIGDFNDETNFPHKLLLTDTRALRLCEPSANNLLANLKLSKTELSKMVQSGGFTKYFADTVLRKIQKGAPILAKDATEYFVGKKINEVYW